MDKMIRFICLILLFVMQCSVLSAVIINEHDLSNNTKYKYSNPVVPQSLPDPTIIRTEDGSFYLYATENIRNIPIYKSNDLINWEFKGTAFNDSTRPVFEPKGGLWAPDINYINGKYVMYYSMSVWGGEWTCGIGVATSDKPDGPFVDLGKLFISKEIGVQNSIDPFFIEDNGRNYLFWGSFRGIYAIELAHDGLSLMPSAQKQQIAGTAYEGVYIMKKNDFYYCFASVGSCCSGVNSTYNTVVGRSENLFGPYVDKSGKCMMDNHHEIFISANNRFVGPGHNSEIVIDECGKSWMFYHAIDKSNPRGRVLMLDEVQWNNYWPFTQTSTPGLEWNIPTFNK